MKTIVVTARRVRRAISNRLGRKQSQGAWKLQRAKIAAQLRSGVVK